MAFKKLSTNKTANEHFPKTIVDTRRLELVGQFDMLMYPPTQQKDEGLVSWATYAL